MLLSLDGLRHRLMIVIRRQVGRCRVNALLLGTIGWLVEKVVTYALIAGTCRVLTSISHHILLLMLLEGNLLGEDGSLGRLLERQALVLCMLGRHISLSLVVEHALRYGLSRA